MGLIITLPSVRLQRAEEQRLDGLGLLARKHGG